MSRYDDIPEVFRRAMEDAGWRGGDEEPEPLDANPQQPWWTNRWLWLIALGILLVASFNWIISTYTEWLWFSEIGYRSVWLKQWGAEVIAFAVAFVIAAVVLLLNWHLARRRALRPGGGVQMMNLPGISWLITGGALFMAFVLAQAASSQWESFLRYLYRVPYGEVDPIYELDISFYLFELPVYNFIRGWFMPLLFITLLGISVIYILNNLPRFQNRQLELRSLPPALRRHAAVLLFFFFLLWALGYWLNVYELVYSPRGVAFGASYTDLRATLPALWIQLALMVLVALAAGYMVFRADARPLLIAGGLWLVGSVGAGGIYPAVLQRYVVEPNELSLEAPYIESNIAFTRMGFGLDELEVFEFTPDNDLTEQDIVENEVAISNIRLWDYRPLQQTYAQLQELRPYYEFTEIDVDRYDLDGETRQVMLAAREMNKAQLPESTWVNRRLIFTHGYGIVMNPVDRVTPQGQPFFYIKNLPPESVVDVEVERPELYYGELTNDVVYVNSDTQEFSYPSGNQNVYSSYEGTGGVPLNGFARRLAFALRFGDTNLVLSDSITPETRAMFHRQIQERVRRVAPFLWLDHDPYIVAANGRLVWMIDAYTISDNFPYSEPTAGTENVPPGINYMRNAVKITVDAYNGDLNFYIVDPDDPIIASYANAFPNLFQPFSAMPEILQQHIRYPEDLFIIQTQQYLTYHMEDVQVFYNKEDLWQIPNEIFDEAAQPMEPYYVTFSLPGEEESEFLLIQPYTPATKNNMIAWLAARNDPEHYGELQVYELPKQELVFGPIQVEARIDQEPTISEQFSLWNQLGSRVIRGNLIVVPINDSFLYVEPVYLRSDTSALPELKRVILASGDSIVMRETLDEALVALLQEAEPVADIVVEPPVSGETTAPAEEEAAGEAPTIEPPAVNATVEELIVAANEHFLAAEAAQRNGDWSAYGRELDALQASLERLLQLTGGELPADTLPGADS